MMMNGFMFTLSLKSMGVSGGGRFYHFSYLRLLWKKKVNQAFLDIDLIKCAPVAGHRRGECITRIR